MPTAPRRDAVATPAPASTPAPTPSPVTLPIPLATTLAVLLMVALPLAGCLGLSDPANTTAGPEGDPDLRPHAHDRWFDPAGTAIDRYPVVDRAVEVVATDAEDDEGLPVVNNCSPPDAGPGNLAVCAGQAEFSPGTWSGPSGEHRIVPPGTSHLEVTLTFSAEDFHEIRMYYRDAEEPTRWKALTNASLGGPFEPGGDTRRLNITVRQADDGHAQVSMWTFLIMVRGTSTPAGGLGGSFLSYGEGPVDVDVVAVRAPGPLPLEPAHPQWWDRDTPPTSVYHIGRLEGEVGRYVQAGPAYGETDYVAPSYYKLHGRGMTWQIPTGFEARAYTPRYDGFYPDKLNHTYSEALVPPGSRMLAVWFKATGEVAAVPPDVCIWGQDVPGEGYPGEKLADCQVLQPGQEQTFFMALTGRDVDSFYTNRSIGLSMSRWTFYVQIVPEEGGVADFDGTVEAHVFVTDKTSFDMPPWARAMVDGGSAPGGGDGNATSAA